MFKRKRVAVGALIRKKVERYPTFSKEPKNRMDCWIECPDFDIRKLKKITKQDEEADRAYRVTIYSSSYEKTREMLDHMIAIGKEEIIADNMKIWLHATRFSIGRVKGQGLYSCVLTYIFRIKAILEEIEENF